MLDNYHDLKVSDIIGPREVVTCDKEATLADALHLILTNSVGAIVITDVNHCPIGIFTERDFITRVSPLKKIDTEKLLVKDFMTPHPTCVRPSAKLSYCYGLMRLNHFRHVIVVDELNGRILNVLSCRDAFYFFCDQM